MAKLTIKLKNGKEKTYDGKEWVWIFNEKWLYVINKKQLLTLPASYFISNVESVTEEIK